MDPNDPSIPYRSWGRSFLVWLLTNFFGWLAILVFAGTTDMFKSEDDKDILYLIVGFAAGGSLFIIPLIRTSLAKAMVFPSGGRRLESALLRTAGIVVIAMLGLTALTCGLGGLAIIMGGFLYLPAALLAMPVAYADWLRGDIETRWLPVYAEDARLPGEASPEVPEEAAR